MPEAPYKYAGGQCRCGGCLYQRKRPNGEIYIFCFGCNFKQIKRHGNVMPKINDMKKVLA